MIFCIKPFNTHCTKSDLSLVLAIKVNSETLIVFIPLFSLMYVCMYVFLIIARCKRIGLFSSAIIHGGWMFLPHLSSYSTRQFYDELECPHRPSHLLVDCLRTKRLKDIMRSQKIISVCHDMSIK